MSPRPIPFPLHDATLPDRLRGHVRYLADTLDYERMAAVVEGLSAAVRDLAAGHP